MSVKRRVVYYLSGFDPRGVRHYHALYKEHFQKQSAINGITGRISSRKKIHNHLYQWEIDAQEHGESVHTIYRFFSWDDIVRAEWTVGLLNYYKDILLFIRWYLMNGLFVPFSKESPKQLIAGLYPLVYLIGALLLASIGGDQIYELLQGVLGIVSGFVFGLGIVFVLQKTGDKVGVFWLLRIYIFCLHLSKNQITSMDERIEHFADQLRDSIKDEDNEEVLLVSHSVGTILAISVLARALEKTADWKKFGMVTLGECIPLVSFQPLAKPFRDELQTIASYSDLVWLDYTAPIDGACFPLHDYMRSSKIERENKNIPLFLSPRFHTLFDKISYKKLRKDWYTTHFLYLMSTDKTGEYDFFTMTAGAKSIRSKYESIKSH